VVVWDKATLSDKLFTSRLSWSSRVGDDVLGRASLAVGEAAERGRLRRVLPLADTLQGEVELLLEWLPLELERGEPGRGQERGQ
jgi:hypothetical protein